MTNFNMNTGYPTDNKSFQPPALDLFKTKDSFSSGFDAKSASDMTAGFVQAHSGPDMDNMNDLVRASVATVDTNAPTLVYPFFDMAQLPTPADLDLNTFNHFLAPDGTPFGHGYPNGNGDLHKTNTQYDGMIDPHIIFSNETLPGVKGYPHHSTAPGETIGQYQYPGSMDSIHYVTFAQPHHSGLTPASTISHPIQHNKLWTSSPASNVSFPDTFPPTVTSYDLALLGWVTSGELANSALVGSQYRTDTHRAQSGLSELLSQSLADQKTIQLVPANIPRNRRQNHVKSTPLRWQGIQTVASYGSRKKISKEGKDTFVQDSSSDNVGTTRTQKRRKVSTDPTRLTRPSGNTDLIPLPTDYFPTSVTVTCVTGPDRTNPEQKFHRGHPKEVVRRTRITENLMCKCCRHGYCSARGLTEHYRIEQRCPIYQKMRQSEDRICPFCKLIIEGRPNDDALKEHAAICEAIGKLIKGCHPGKVTEEDVKKY